MAIKEETCGFPEAIKAYKDLGHTVHLSLDTTSPTSKSFYNFSSQDSFSFTKMREDNKHVS